MDKSRLSKMDHVALNVADIERATAWYLTSFSCELLMKTPVFALLQFENIKLALVLPSQQPAHIGYPRADAGSFGELRQQKDGLFSSFISDPSGNVVELASTDPGICE